MADQPRARPLRASAVPAWLAGLGVLLAALLVMSNVLLWQIADDTSGGGGTSKTSSNAAPKQQALLPPPSQGTSNKAASQEIDKLTHALDRQFRGLQSNLTPFRSGLSALGQLPNQFGQSLVRLDELSSQGRLLGGIAGSALASGSRRLGAAQAALRRIRLNTGVLRATGRGTTQQLATSNAGIASTNSRLKTMNGTLTQTLKAIGGVNTNTGDVATQVKDMKQSIAGLRTDIQRLNNEFVVYFRVFCTTLSSPPAGCPSP